MQRKIIKFYIFLLIGIPLVIYGYTFYIHQKELSIQKQQEEVAQRIYNSIPTNFMHFIYEDASGSAKVIKMYNPKPMVDGISNEGTFSARIEQVIPKTNTRDIHIIWEDLEKINHHDVLVRALQDNDFSATPSATTTDEFVITPVPAYKDMVIKIAACDRVNCAFSHPIYLPQIQKQSFTISQVVNGEAAQNKKISLFWQKVDTALKYNIFVKHSSTEDYDNAIKSTKSPSVDIEVDKTIDNYIIVQACNTKMCFSSNEVLVSSD